MVTYKDLESVRVWSLLFLSIIIEDHLETRRNLILGKFRSLVLDYLYYES